MILIFDDGGKPERTRCTFDHAGLSYQTLCVHVCVCARMCVFLSSKVSRNSVLSQVVPTKQVKRPQRTLTEELKQPGKASCAAASCETAPSQCKQLLWKGFICRYIVALWRI